MPKFSIAFITPADKNPIRHRIIESTDQESALKIFFKEDISEFYSDDDQGYFYFKEDFSGPENAMGSILTCS